MLSATRCLNRGLRSTMCTRPFRHLWAACSLTISTSSAVRGRFMSRPKRLTGRIRKTLGSSMCATVKDRMSRFPRSQTSRSEEHTSELQSRLHLVCRLLLEKKKKKTYVASNATQYEYSKSPIVSRKYVEYDLDQSSDCTDQLQCLHHCISH